MHHVAHVLREWNVELESEHLQRCDIRRRHPCPEFSSEDARTDQGRTDPSEVFYPQRLCRAASWAAHSFG
jgi:hypothetical protein